MTRESDFIARLRALATHPAARGLRDDAAVLAVTGNLVLTHDMMVEGVHFLPNCPAGDVAWKLVAVNLSDLAAKGAKPIGVLTGCGFARDADWDARFVTGLGEALRHFDTSLLGGDTVTMPDGAPRTLGLTAIGQAPPAGAPARSGARPGDRLWVTGHIGDAGLGLAMARGERTGTPALLARYRRPMPRLSFGQGAAALVHAMADVSDGLLIDARRMAEASRLAAHIDLAAMPLSADFLETAGTGRAARLAAATAGDDYELLFAASAERDGSILALAAELGTIATMVGRFTDGEGVHLSDRGQAIDLPARLGFQHG